MPSIRSQRTIFLSILYLKFRLCQLGKPLLRKLNQRTMGCPNLLAIMKVQKRSIWFITSLCKSNNMYLVKWRIHIYKVNSLPTQNSKSMFTCVLYNTTNSSGGVSWQITLGFTSCCICHSTPRISHPVQYTKTLLSIHGIFTVYKLYHNVVSNYLIQFSQKRMNYDSIVIPYHPWRS